MITVALLSVLAVTCCILLGTIIGIEYSFPTDEP